MSEPLPTDAQRGLRDQIVENQKIIDRLNADLARKTQEVRIIQQVSREITSTLRVEEILGIILQSLDETLGFRHAMILLVDDAGEALHVAASRGYPESGVGAGVPVGVGTIGVVAKRRRIMRVGNLKSAKAYGAAVRSGMDGGGPANGPAATLPGLPDGQSQIAIPLVSKDRLIGVFAVESPVPAAFDAVDEVLVTILAHQAASAIHNAQLYQAEERRLLELNAVTEKLAFLNETLEAQVRARTAELGDANEKMAAALLQVQREKTRSQELLGRMAPPEVIPLMLDNTLLARRLHATMLFTDLEGFTKFSSGMEPDELFTKLNYFFSRAGLSIAKYRGYVNKTNGDAIMALFGVPYEQPTHALDAVLAGLDMQREIQAHFSLRMRIGINTGPITAGILGPRDKSLYDVLGDPVNVASRMEKACPAGFIAVSDGTYGLIEPYFEIKALGEQEVKGKGAMMVYQVIGVKRLVDDRRRVDPTSAFARAHANLEAEIGEHKARLTDVDLRSIQARDGAINHNETVAALALALLRSLRSGMSGLPAGLASSLADVDEEDLVRLALLHDLGKHALDHGRLNDPNLTHPYIESLRSELEGETAAGLETLGFGRLQPALRELYAFERSRGDLKACGLLATLVAAPDIYDALAAPKMYKGKGWTIVGSLEELLRLPRDPATTAVFRAFVELMRPDAAKITDTRTSEVKFK